MKKIILCSVMGVMVALCGCVSPQYNYHPATQNISKPEIGSINEVSVGDKMITQGVSAKREAYYIPEMKKKFLMTVQKGYYLKTGEDEKGSYYQPINSIPDGGNFLGGAILSILVTPENKFCFIDIYSHKVCHFNNIGEVREISTSSDNTFQQTLIYSGKVGSKINIGYREFSSNTARPAFNNDVEYDLSQSNEIGYKGALLEIISATNQSIKYRVVRNFNKSE